MYNPAEWTEQDRKVLDALRKLTPEELEKLEKEIDRRQDGRQEKD